MALPKRDELPEFMQRIAAHLAEKGMPEPHAVATAVQTARKFCAEGDTNWPGEQHINGGSQQDACAALAEYDARHGAPEPEPAVEAPAEQPEAAPAEADAAGITDKAFDADPSRFTDEEWARSCLLDRGPLIEDVRQRYKLPVREPDGTVNRNAVHSAAGSLRKVHAPHAALVKAAQLLVALYGRLGERPPSSVETIAAAGTVAAAAQEQRARPEPGGVEERAAPGLELEGKKLRGRIPFGEESRDLGGWREVMEPGCLDKADLSELVCTVDHVGLPVGRYPGTIQLESRSDGLHWAVDLPESRADVREAVERKDITGASWRMVVARDRWVGNVRHVEEVRSLLDVAAVVRPAYAVAGVELRSQPNANEDTNTKKPESQEETMEAEAPEQEETITPQAGGLTVEDRAAAPENQTGATVEARVLDAMRGVPKGEARDLTTADASAGPVTPPQLSTYMWDLLRDRTVVLASGVPVITTSNKTVKWPRLVSDATADFYDELEEITESDPGFDEFEVDPKAIKALVRGSSEAFDDSDPDLLTIVRQNLETILALKLDRELLVGNAAKGFPGMTNTTGVNVIDAAGAATNYDIFAKAIGVLAGKHVPGPYAIATHPWVATHFNLLHDTIGNVLQRPDGVPAFATTTQIGHDDTDHTASAVVYAPRSLAVVRRQDVEILVDRSQEFTKDAVLVRGKLRASLFVPYPAAVCVIENLPAPDPSA